MARNFDPATLGELMETVVETRRVSKTVKGGRIMRFAAVVVVGDQNGHVGYGIGKSAEVPEAIRKAIEDAKKNIIEVSLKNTTIPHDIIGEFGAENKDNAAERAEYYEYYIRAAAERGIPCFVWDNGPEDSYGLLDRDNCTWYDQNIIDGIMRAAQ